MKKPVVVVYNELYEEALQYIKERCDVRYFPGERDEKAFQDALREADGLIGSGLTVDDALLEQAPKLKIVANKSVGYDNLDMKALSNHGIQATNTPGVLDDTVADTAMALMLAAARRVTEMDQFVKTGQWEQEPFHHFGVDVHHKTLGIIGLGGIGEVIAKRAHFGFDMPILYHNRSPKPEAEKRVNAVYCSMDELLEQSDFVCVMTPLTPETKGMIGADAFRKMKKTAVFLNVSRGPVVDEAALIDALKNGDILAAGLDVFEQEPVSSTNPLLSMPNVVTLPHIGSATHETRLKMALLAAENVVAGVHGEPLKTPIRA